MAFGDSDLPVFFSDFAVPIIFGGVTKPGILDVNDSREGSGDVDVVGRLSSFTVPSSSFPTLVREAAITVNGIAMKVRDFLQLDDGAVTRVWVVFP